MNNLNQSRSFSLNSTYRPPNSLFGNHNQNYSLTPGNIPIENTAALTGSDELEELDWSAVELTHDISLGSAKETTQIDPRKSNTDESNSRNSPGHLKQLANKEAEQAAKAQLNQLKMQKYFVQTAVALGSYLAYKISDNIVKGHAPLAIDLVTDITRDLQRIVPRLFNDQMLTTLLSTTVRTFYKSVCNSVYGMMKLEESVLSKSDYSRKLLVMLRKQEKVLSKDETIIPAIRDKVHSLHMFVKEALKNNGYLGDTENNVLTAVEYLLKFPKLQHLYRTDLQISKAMERNDKLLAKEPEPIREALTSVLSSFIRGSSYIAETISSNGLTKTPARPLLEWLHLWGPPGTGKTTLIREFSEATGIPMIETKLEKELYSYGASCDSLALKLKMIRYGNPFPPRKIGLECYEDGYDSEEDALLHRRSKKEDFDFLSRKFQASEFTKAFVNAGSNRDGGNSNSNSIIIFIDEADRVLNADRSWRAKFMEVFGQKGPKHLFFEDLNFALDFSTMNILFLTVGNDKFTDQATNSRALKVYKAPTDPEKVRPIADNMLQDCVPNYDRNADNNAYKDDLDQITNAFNAAKTSDLRDLQRGIQEYLNCETHRQITKKLTDKFPNFKSTPPVFNPNEYFEKVDNDLGL